MPSQQLINELDAQIDENRKKLNLPPLVPCAGNCGRRVENGLCGTCGVRTEMFQLDPECGVCKRDIDLFEQAALVQLRNGSRYLAHTPNCLKSSINAMVDRAMQPKSAA